MLATPAAAPPGWARMPPPDMNSRSSLPTAAQVGATVPAHWPEEKAGITRSSKAPSPATSGARQSRADSITSSSGCENLPCSPCTCMWSTPASRHSAW